MLMIQNKVKNLGEKAIALAKKKVCEALLPLEKQIWFPQQSFGDGEKKKLFKKN